MRPPQTDSVITPPFLRIPAQERGERREERGGEERGERREERGERREERGERGEGRGERGEGRGERRGKRGENSNWCVRVPKTPLRSTTPQRTRFTQGRHSDPRYGSPRPQSRSAASLPPQHFTHTRHRQPHSGNRSAHHRPSLSNTQPASPPTGTPRHLLQSKLHTQARRLQQPTTRSLTHGPHLISHSIFDSNPIHPRSTSSPFSAETHHSHNSRVQHRPWHPLNQSRSSTTPTADLCRQHSSPISLRMTPGTTMATEMPEPALKSIFCSYSTFIVHLSCCPFGVHHTALSPLLICFYTTCMLPSVLWTYFHAATASRFTPHHEKTKAIEISCDLCFPPKITDLNSACQTILGITTFA